MRRSVVPLVSLVSVVSVVLVMSLLIAGGPAVAAIPGPGPPTAATLDAWLLEVRAASFPELGDAPLTIERFSSDTVFFMSNIDVGSALHGGPLHLQLFINDAVLDDDADVPGEIALKAVLAHELAHSLDYVQRFSADGAAGLLPLLPMLAWAPAEEEIERRTDLVAVRRGYGFGLAAYRRWLYRRLPAEAVLEKRRIYYSPLELVWLERLATQCPAALDTAIAHPPRDARAIARLGPATCFR
jgi:hypothetical protein